MGSQAANCVLTCLEHSSSIGRPPARLISRQSSVLALLRMNTLAVSDCRMRKSYCSSLIRACSSVQPAMRSTHCSTRSSRRSDSLDQPSRWLLNGGHDSSSRRLPRFPAVPELHFRKVPCDYVNAAEHEIGCVKSSSSWTSLSKQRPSCAHQPRV
jgi:hypothetical protein